MNLTVEWVSRHSLNKEPWTALQEIPVIRVDTLRQWLTERNAEHLHDLLAQLPEDVAGQHK